MLNFDDKIICQYFPAVNCAVIYNQIITHFQKGLGNNKYIKTTQPGYSVSHIITYPSKELCSKMALGEGGVSLP